MSLPTLLELFHDENQRCKLWIASDADGPLPLLLRSGRDYWELDARYIPILRDTGLLPLVRLLSIRRRLTLDASLLSALVDMWRPKTHTFHFRWGDMTVTLQDILFLSGLPIRGEPLVLGRPSVDWKAMLEHQFGIHVPKHARGVLRTWLRLFS